MRPTRLSEIEDQLNPELRHLVSAIAQHGAVVYPHVAAKLLGLSVRRIYQLCELRDLEGLYHPRLRVITASLLRFVLSRNGYHNIEVDRIDNPFSSCGIPSK